MSRREIAVVGLVGGECFGRGARYAIASATLVVGSERHLAGIVTSGRKTPLRATLEGSLDLIARSRERHERTCVLASGDPGFFGIVRVLAERFGSDALHVYPAPSSVSLAFARVGINWDDAVVVSAHGRPLAAAVAAARRGRKVAVLTSPDNPPEALGSALVSAGCAPCRVYVATRIGEPTERFVATDLDGLAHGAFPAMSVVLLLNESEGPTLAWGLPEDAYTHRDGMITKAEVRAVVLSKLALPAVGVLWDVGAGSGSVAIESARLSPGMRVLAIERAADDARRLRANVTAHGVAVEVVEDDAPDVFARLPDPDRVFVGGGGLPVLDAALARLRPGGVVVATYTLVARAAEAAERLGNLVQLTVARGVGTGELGVRLAAENPVFVCWGP